MAHSASLLGGVGSGQSRPLLSLLFLSRENTATDGQASLRPCGQQARQLGDVEN